MVNQIIDSPCEAAPAQCSSVFWARLYIGLIVFTCAELFAGSSGIWIVSPWAWIVTFPLYFGHFFFFTTLAAKTRSCSLPSLYFWGSIFALYETWITKVIWKGYGLDGFAMGQFAGFGMHETLTLTGFWHPIGAFLLPLAIATSLMSGESSRFGSSLWLLSDARWAKFSRIFLYVAYIATLAHNSGTPLVVFANWIPTSLILWFGYRKLKSRLNQPGATDEVLVFGRIGFAVVTIYLILLYGITYLWLHPMPDFRASVFVQLISLAFYPVLLFLIYLKRDVKISITAPVIEASQLIWRFMAIGLVAAALSGAQLLGLPVITPLFISVLLIEMVVGLCIFIRVMLIRKQSVDKEQTIIADAGPAQNASKDAQTTQDHC